VFGVEYSLPLAEFCDGAARRGFSTIKKRLSLKAFRAICG